MDTRKIFGDAVGLDDVDKKVFIYTRYKYMDGRLIEIHYPQKKEFYSNLGMGNVTDTDQKHYKRDWKDFGLKNLG